MKQISRWCIQKWCLGSRWVGDPQDSTQVPHDCSKGMTHPTRLEIPTWWPWQEDAQGDYE
jgi:hypothetical protein